MCARCCPALIAVFAAMASAAIAEEFRPHFDQSALKAGAQSYPYVRIESPWHSDVLIDGMRYRVDGDSVVQTDDKTRNVIRKARAADGAKLRWHGASHGIAYFTQKVVRGFGFPVAEKRPAVRRLQMSTMAWLAPLELVPNPPADSRAVPAREAAAVKWSEEWNSKFPKSDEKANSRVGEPGRGAGLCDVVVTDAGVAILSYSNYWAGIDNVPWRATLGFQLALFPPGSDTPRWSQWIDYPEDPQHESPFASNPSIAIAGEKPAINRLTWTKTGIVVCLPDTYELLCFDENGEQTWRLPRIWEFERGRLSPDGWEIDRFGFEVEENVTAGIPKGVDPKDAGAERKAAQDEIDKMVREQRAVRAERSERFYKDYKAWIVAGPLRVPSIDDDLDEERLLFAVAKARYPFNSIAASECTIYQVIGVFGSVEAMTTLPRLVYPRKHIALRGASIWTCEGGSIARMGIDAWDETSSRVEWYREYPGLAPSDDYYDGASTEVSCTTADQLFRTGSKYRVADGEKVLAFQINVVDLTTGLARDLTLSVPFEGKIPAHEEEPAGDSGCTQGFGRREFKIAIEELKIDGNMLRVAIRTGKTQTSVEFDVSALLKKPDPE